MIKVINKLKDSVTLKLLELQNKAVFMLACSTAVFGNDCAVVDTNEDKNVAKAVVGWVVTIVLIILVVGVIATLVLKYKGTTGKLSGIFDQIENMIK